MSDNPNNTTTNVSESTKEAQQQQPEVASAQGRSRIISVQGNDINKVVNTQTGNQPPKATIGTNGTSVTTTAGDKTGDVAATTAQPQPQLQPQPQKAASSGPAPSTTSASSTGQTGQAQEVPDNDDVDIDKMISTSEQEVKTIDADQQARIDKQKRLMDAINSRAYFERLIYNNIETGQVIGTKLKYTKDPYGKTVYDYMNDPEISEHIEFTAAEGDPMDGSPVDRQVTFFWKKPTF